jgi:hypothetical protein
LKSVEIFTGFSKLEKDAAASGHNSQG